MLYLVYLSTATQLFSSADLQHLLCQSRENNCLHGITGLLLYDKGQFMQLLEGHDEAVLDCYGKICADTRHTDVLKLAQKPIRSRFFPAWSMAFHNFDDSFDKGCEAGISSFLNTPYSSRDLGEHIHEGIFLLLSFKKQSQS